MRTQSNIIYDIRYWIYRILKSINILLAHEQNFGFCLSFHMIWKARVTWGIEEEEEEAEGLTEKNEIWATNLRLAI